MNDTEKIFVCGFTPEEVRGINILLDGLGAPSAVLISADRAGLRVDEIIFTDKVQEPPCIIDEHLMLFYNVEPGMIPEIMRGFHTLDTDRPIFAIVTPESIEWKLPYLVEHLKDESAFITKRRKEKRANHQRGTSQ
ncbi:MAG: DUF3783 domain-containing protein [Thermodesulfobacteriota bacterium]|nr:DUF3783 domain-containing protein [Thermodesulfobacteriota bacterium]